MAALPAKWKKLPAQQDGGQCIDPSADSTPTSHDLIEWYYGQIADAA